MARRKRASKKRAIPPKRRPLKLTSPQRRQQREFFSRKVPRKPGTRRAINRRNGKPASYVQQTREGERVERMRTFDFRGLRRREIQTMQRLCERFARDKLANYKHVSARHLVFGGVQAAKSNPRDLIYWTGLVEIESVNDLRAQWRAIIGLPGDYDEEDEMSEDYEEPDRPLVLATDIEWSKR
jgi:hypothetical protein